MYFWITSRTSYRQRKRVPLLWSMPPNFLSPQHQRQRTIHVVEHTPQVVLNSGIGQALALVTHNQTIHTRVGSPRCPRTEEGTVPDHNCKVSVILVSNSVCRKTSVIPTSTAAEMVTNLITGNHQNLNARYDKMIRTPSFLLKTVLNVSLASTNLHNGFMATHHLK